jgi:hypothetical protein
MLTYCHGNQSTPSAKEDLEVMIIYFRDNQLTQSMKEVLVMSSIDYNNIQVLSVKEGDLEAMLIGYAGI